MTNWTGAAVDDRELRRVTLRRRDHRIGDYTDHHGVRGRVTAVLVRHGSTPKYHGYSPVGGGAVRWHGVSAVAPLIGEPQL